jgi:hypothetical protein
MITDNALRYFDGWVRSYILTGVKHYWIKVEIQINKYAYIIAKLPHICLPHPFSPKWRVEKRQTIFLLESQRRENCLFYCYMHGFEDILLTISCASNFNDC